MSNFDLNAFINETQSPMDELNKKARQYQKRWEPTGLLDGIKNENERGGMAVLLENQARQLITENSKTGTTTSSEQWNGVALPLVRKVFAEIAAKEFVSVQPMNLPSGLVFYMDFQYGTSIAPRTSGQSVYGDTTSSTAPNGGLYGAGQFGYSINEVTQSVGGGGAGIVSTIAATSASMNYQISPAGYVEVAVPFASMSGVDMTAIRSFVPSGSQGGLTNVAFFSYLPQFTRLDTTQQNVVFVISGSATTASVSQVQFSKQPTSQARGDFEDQTVGGLNSVTTNLNIPEINIVLNSIPIVAKTRKLKAVWTPELAQDLNAYHSIDAEAELTAMLSEYISLEIDLEILEMLLINAQTTGYWSSTIGNVWNGNAFVADTNISGQAWTTMTWNQTLGNVMQGVSNKIHQLTLRGGANWAVVSPSVATLIESIPGFAGDTDGEKSNFAMGVTKMGALKNRWTIYKNPYITSNVVLMGFRGSSFLECGAAYCPYIPLIMTPLVYDPQNFTPRRGALTRYAKVMLRSEFYGKVLCQNVV